MPEDRRLAAIMFTDIVGYTALMGSDEDKAFEVLKKNQEIHTKLIQQFNGTLIKEMGDGMLVSFHLASQAVRCAIAIQKACKEQDIPLKIGIHEGEMVFAGEDVLGDSVNIASRLQDDAEDGYICISDTVYRDVRNKGGINVDFIEEKLLKNVIDPIKVYNVLTKETKIKETRVVSPHKSFKSSIAVLPFVNMSNDPGQEFFCDGMAEEIINSLSQIKNLKVIARTSSFLFKGINEDIREIGKKLDVETLLEGSVRRTGNRLRITAQLIKVSDGSHLLSERFDRDLEDVFAIQDEISLAIVNNLKVKLLGIEKKVMVKRQTENIEAYNLYLKGAYHLNTFTSVGFKKAIEYYWKSLKLDPNYALAYVGLALVPIVSSTVGNVKPNEAFPKAKQYIETALGIDKTLGEAHSALGFINVSYDWNWDTAEKELKQALQLIPNDAYTHQFYSILLVSTARKDEAISSIKQAQMLDPHSSNINTSVGQVYFSVGQYDKAIEAFQFALTINPTNFLAQGFLGISFLGKSMIKKAIDELEKVQKHSWRNTTVAWLACAYYEIGKKEKAKKLIESVIQISKKVYVPPTCIFAYFMIQGDLETAYKWLERACYERDIFVPSMRFFPMERYRIPDKPKFMKLLKEVGLGS